MKKINPTKQKSNNSTKLSLKEHKDFLYSALKGEKDKVADFILRGVDINFENTHGETAIYLASGKGNHDMVKFLLDKGADGTIITASKQTVLHNASAAASVPTLQVFKENGISQLNFETFEGSTELLLAAKTGKPDVVKYLIENGSNINFRDIKGTSAVHHAVQHNSLEVLKVLSSNGAKLSERSYAEIQRGESPLHLAMRENLVDMMEYLLGQGAKISCCVSCRRGKACKKVPPKFIDWYQAELRAKRKHKRGDMFKCPVSSAPRLLTTLDCTEEEDSQSESPTLRRSFFKRILSASRTKKKEN